MELSIIVVCAICGKIISIIYLLLPGTVCMVFEQTPSFAAGRTSLYIICGPKEHGVICNLQRKCNVVMYVCVLQMSFCLSVCQSVCMYVVCTCYVCMYARMYMYEWMYHPGSTQHRKF